MKVTRVTNANVRTAIAAAALTVSMGALASEPTSFADLDADQSGAIDQQESQQNTKLAETFSAADTDKNGELSQQEYSYAMARIRMEEDPATRS